MPYDEEKGKKKKNGKFRKNEVESGIEEDDAHRDTLGKNAADFIEADDRELNRDSEYPSRRESMVEKQQ